MSHLPTLCLLVPLAVLGCATSPPAPTPAVIAPTPEVLAPDASDSGNHIVEATPSSEDVASTPPAPLDAGTAAPPSNPCRGRAFDLGQLPTACTGPRATAPPAKLTASLVLGETSAKAGAQIEVTLALTNTSKDDLPVSLTSGCDDLQVQAFRGNKRADYENTVCGFGKGCGGATYHLVIEPGGAITKRLRYRVNFVRVAKDCKDVETPLPPGRYDLRVDSSSFFTFHDAVAKVSAPLVVTR